MRSFLFFHGRLSHPTVELIERLHNRDPKPATENIPLPLDTAYRVAIFTSNVSCPSADTSVGGGDDTGQPSVTDQSFPNSSEPTPYSAFPLVTFSVERDVRRAGVPGPELGDSSHTRA